MYLTRADLARARRNRERYAWAREVADNLIRQADEWAAKEDAALRALLPPPRACFAYGFSGCPICQGSIGTWGVPSASFDDPGHVRCANGHRLPDTEHPEAGTGWVDANGKEYYFYMEIAEILRHYRDRAHPNGIALAEHPKFRAFYLLPQSRLHVAGHPPTLGDGSRNTCRLEPRSTPMAFDLAYLEKLDVFTSDGDAKAELARLLLAATGGDPDKGRAPPPRTATGFSSAPRRSQRGSSLHPPILHPLTGLSLGASDLLSQRGLFRVEGGTRHDYVFHGRGTRLATEWLALGAPRPGSRAGPEEDWGARLGADGDVIGIANRPYWNPPPGNGFGFLRAPRGRTAPGRRNARSATSRQPVCA